MTVAQRYVAQQYAGRGGPSGLADVLEVLLDKGLVIDAYVRVSLIGIELLTIDVRVVVASVDTYLRFAEATNRLDLTYASSAQTLGELVGKDDRRERERARREEEDDEDDDGDDRGFVSRALGRNRDDDEPVSHAGDDLEPSADDTGDDDTGDDDTGEDAGAVEDAADDQAQDDDADATDEAGDDEAGDAQGEADDDDDTEKESGSGVLSRLKQRGQAF